MAENIQFLDTFNCLHLKFQCFWYLESQKPGIFKQRKSFSFNFLKVNDLIMNILPDTGACVSVSVIHFPSMP